MKENYVATLNTNEEITDFFMVKNISIKIGSNKKQYLDIFLGDNTGEIASKKWDVADTELDGLNKIEVGDIVKVKAQVNEWNGMQQLKIGKIRKAVDQDGIDIKDYIKAAPEDPKEMYDFILAQANNINEPGLKKICVRLLEENSEKLLYYPAAAKNHHAELAGLLWHMKRMLMMAVRYCEVYTNLNQDLLVTGVIIHDIEKLEEMISDKNGIVSEYSFEGQMLGHLIQGVKTIDRYAEDAGLSKEKAVMLEHMILSHHYEPEYGSPKKPLFPEAEILHYLDVVDANMYDMEEALNATNGGEFSERIWTLDNRRLYKQNDK